jgi:hypothetical protein
MNIKLRKQLFLAIRDLPYKIGTKSKDTSCVAKTKLLGELLTRIGLECQVWKAVVNWEDTGLPTELLQLTPKPKVNHLFLKVLIPERKKWVIVDAAWDNRFADELPVNDWDGLSDTTLAYSSDRLELVGSVDEFEFRNFDPEEIFTKKLNAWYESLAERKI